VGRKFALAVCFALFLFPAIGSGSEDMAIEEVRQALKKMEQKINEQPLQTSKAQPDATAMAHAIRKNWTLPEEIDRTEKLEVKISLSYDAHGYLSSFSLLQKSGNRVFDDSVIMAVAKSTYLPDLPEKPIQTEMYFSSGRIFK
jgi:outer membrane biosynthesis protein TonB